MGCIINLVIRRFMIKMILSHQFTSILVNWFILAVDKCSIKQKALMIFLKNLTEQ